VEKRSRRRRAFSALELLFEEDGLADFHLPDRLRQRYAGSIGFPEGCLYANFVSSLDGVVALEGVRDSPYLISGASKADRFVMGLLRACADAVLIGAATMRDAPGHEWTPGYLVPDLADDFARLRRALGKEDEPRLVVVTGSGDLDPGEPALRRGAILLTTQKGAAVLEGRLSCRNRIVPLTGGPAIDVASALRFLASEGLRTVLSEAGPRLFGQLLGAGLVDELFLTVSPLIAGRASDGRPGLVAEELLPEVTRAGRLLSVRRHESYLFLRYALRQDGVARRT
jgi:riboflavin biosynthesis pyrimidine reductase